MKSDAITVERFYTGLGRPQGLAFDIEGRLWVAASWRGRGGILRFRDGQPEMAVSGAGIVGMAFDLTENLVIVDTGALYRVRVSAIGKPLP